MFKRVGVLVSFEDCLLSSVNRFTRSSRPRGRIEAQSCVQRGKADPNGVGSCSMKHTSGVNSPLTLQLAKPCLWDQLCRNLAGYRLGRELEVEILAVPSFCAAQSALGLNQRREYPRPALGLAWPAPHIRILSLHLLDCVQTMVPGIGKDPAHPGSLATSTLVAGAVGRYHCLPTSASPL